MIPTKFVELSIYKFAKSIKTLLSTDRLIKPKLILKSVIIESKIIEKIE